MPAGQGIRGSSSPRDTATVITAPDANVVPSPPARLENERKENSMTKGAIECRNIQYYRGLFIKSVTINGHSFPTTIPKYHETITIEWTHRPIRACTFTKAQSTWLSEKGFGVPVTLSISVDGIPDEDTD